MGHHFRLIGGHGRSVVKMSSILGVQTGSKTNVSAVSSSSARISLLCVRRLWVSDVLKQRALSVLQMVVQKPYSPQTVQVAFGFLGTSTRSSKELSSRFLTFASTFLALRRQEFQYDGTAETSHRIAYTLWEVPLPKSNRVHSRTKATRTEFFISSESSLEDYWWGHFECMFQPATAPPG